MLILTITRPRTSIIKQGNASLYNYNKNKEEGHWERYWSNGQLRYKGNLKNGKRVGNWVSYWDDGKLRYKGDYKKLPLLH